MDNLNNNQQLVSRQEWQQSLTPTKALKWMTDKYPLLSQQKRFIASLREAVMANDSQLSVIDAKLKGDVTQLWLRLQLTDVLRFCGAFEFVKDVQVIVTARQIRNKYFYLTPTELSFFFESFAAGSYGTLYVGKTINPQIIMQAVRTFENEVINKRAEIESEAEQAKEKQERDLIKQGKTGVQAWASYCKTHNIKEQPLPMQAFLKEMRKKSLM